VQGTVLATFLIVFREALEAGLILGIILTVLVKLKQRRYFPLVILSSVAGILASVIAGFFIMSLIDSTQGIVEKWIEGGVSLAACCVLTYMVFWMDRQSKRIKPEIEFQVEEAATKGELVAIVSLPFLAVFREGAETVLFVNSLLLKSAMIATSSSAASGTAVMKSVTIKIKLFMIMFFIQTFHSFSDAALYLTSSEPSVPLNMSFFDTFHLRRQRILKR